MEYQIDLNSETWKGIKEIINRVIQQRMEELVGDIDPVETAKRRGSIVSLKHLIGLVEKPIIK